MWLMMTKGALSITVSPKEPDKLQVRARRKEWLEAFRAYCPELGPDIHTTNADYQWRALAKPEDVARAVARLTLDIDYSNFKSATMQPERGLKDSKLRHSLHDAYSKIWGTLLAAGDGTSSMDSKSVGGTGTIAACTRLGHWWPAGTEKCVDCKKENPNYPEAGPRGKPTQAEVRAWWAAKRAGKPKSPKQAAQPSTTVDWARKRASAKAKINHEGSGWDVCPGSGMSAAKGSMDIRSGVTTGACRMCGATVPLALDSWEIRSHSQSDGQLLEEVV